MSFFRYIMSFIVAPTPVVETHVDVLVIGAGPAGLMCANALAKAGVNVRIIDKRPNKVAAGQADGIQPRTIEVLQSYGLAERLLQEGNQMHMAAFYNPNANGEIECTGRAPDVTAPTARYPHEVTLHQGAIEAIFLDSMRSYGLEVERPIAPTRLDLSDDEAELKDPSSYPVKVTIHHLNATGKTEIVRAKFVVGADGAHSWVRKSMNIAMEGEQTDYIWGVMDMVPRTDFPDIRNRTVIHSVNGSCMIIPREGDTVRLYIQLSDTDVIDPQTGRINKSGIDPETLLKVARKIFFPYIIETPSGIDWCSTYIIGQRVASAFSVKNRVFIAGDACHTHSPKAGQGMNASMNDTHNLAWKLTQVLRGWTDIALLQTYESERRKYAQDLINFDKKFAALFSGKPQTTEHEGGVTHEQFLQAFQTFGGFTSGIGVLYSPSLIVDIAHQSCASNLTIGQRMPPHIIVRAADSRPFEIQDLLPADSRFKVLVFTGNISDRSQLAKVFLLTEEMEKSDSFLNRYLTGTDKNVASMFEILTITAGRKDDVNFLCLPSLLRSHWSKVFVDDTDVTGSRGGHAYVQFGIDVCNVTLVIIRPDGYVGMVAPTSSFDEVNHYFASFMKSSTEH